MKWNGSWDGTIGDLWWALPPFISEQFYFYSILWYLTPFQQILFLLEKHVGNQKNLTRTVGYKDKSKINWLNHKESLWSSLEKKSETNK